MGCGEECAFMPGVKIEDWDLPDPAGKPIDFMRNIRDEIENRVVSLIKDFGSRSRLET
jgi:protein-tyrosine-phosphatase